MLHKTSGASTMVNVAMGSPVGITAEISNGAVIPG